MQDPGATARNSPGVPHARLDLYASATERPLARKVPGGDTTGLLSSPQIACTTQRPLQPPRRDTRHGLRAAGSWSRKVAQEPGETQLAEERDPRGSGAGGLRPPREPGAKKRTSRVKREDQATHRPGPLEVTRNPGAPAGRGRSQRSGPRPLRTALWAGTHLLFRKSVDRLPESGRHGAGAQRGVLDAATG